MGLILVTQITLCTWNVARDLLDSRHILLEVGGSTEASPFPITANLTARVECKMLHVQKYLKSLRYLPPGMPP